MNILKGINYQYHVIRDWFKLWSFWMKKKHFHQLPTSKTILVIRIDAIGDCIIWLDQAKEYRKSFPNHKIVLLHNKVWTEIAEHLPWFDEFIAFDRSQIGNFSYYKTLFSTLNKYTYEKVYSPVFSRDFFTVDCIVHNVNAKEKIGYEGDYQNNNGILNKNLYFIKNKNNLHLKERADKWYSYLVPNDKKNIMELQRNAHFVRKTLNDKFKCKLPTLPFASKNEIPFQTKVYAVLFVGASTVSKMWPVENFLKITDYIPFQDIILCGSEKERLQASFFTSSYKGNKTIIDLTGKTSLIELISFIANASIVITNDSSASHIAVATHTPSICLLGGGHYGRFHPYQADTINEEEEKIIPTVITAHDKTCFNCNCICKYPLQNERWKCINNILVDDVINAIKQKLM